MPFKVHKVRLVYGGGCHCSCESRLIRTSSGRFEFKDFNICKTEMPDPSMSNAGLLLESGVQFKDVGTTINPIPSPRSYSEDDDQEFEKEEYDFSRG